jgi:hypothetical protein
MKATFYSFNSRTSPEQRNSKPASGQPSYGFFVSNIAEVPIIFVLKNTFC